MFSKIRFLLLSQHFWIIGFANNNLHMFTFNQPTLAGSIKKQLWWIKQIYIQKTTYTILQRDGDQLKYILIMCSRLPCISFCICIICSGSRGTVVADLFARPALCSTKRYWCWLLLKERELTYCKNIPGEKSPPRFNSTGTMETKVHPLHFRFLDIQCLLTICHLWFCSVGSALLTQSCRGECI